MANHIEVGRRYPEISINTAYSFGLDDQEFVVSFECDDPGEFLDLVQELRGTESSSYTLRDTPIFTCVAMSLGRALDALDGTAATAVAPPAACSNSTRQGHDYPFRARRDRHRGKSPARRDRRLRARRASTRPSTCSSTRDTHAEVDMFDRLPTPYGLVRVRRRARPSEDQVGDPRLREDRGATRVPLLRQRRGRRSTSASHELARALPRGHLRLRRRRPTAISGSPARTCPGAIRPPSSSTGTTPTPTSPTASSTSPASASS